ncbi:MAG: OmpA family protein [Pseudomonadota bacterium]
MRSSLRRDVLASEDNSERWLVSYADFITLLFALFVVMYAISSVNEDKYKVLSDTLSATFEVPASSLRPIQIGDPTQTPSPHVVDIPDVKGYADVDPGDTSVREPADPLASGESIRGFAAQHGLSVHVDNDWIEINLSADVLFKQGSAELSVAAQAELDRTVAMLRFTKLPITVEGYTDNVSPADDGSNWLLSGARASAVADYLVRSGVRAERLAAIGYGENHPLQTNATPEGRAANRRVSLIVAREQGQARNRNSAAELKLVSRRSDTPVEIEARRTTEGGLLFSNEGNDAPSPDG